MKISVNSPAKEKQKQNTFSMVLLIGL